MVMVKKIPKEIDGVEVEKVDEPMVVKGEKWVTLVPKNENDFRVWEFSLTSGRVIQTVEGIQEES